MTISEDRLLAYADGLLSPEETLRIAQELAEDADARALVEALRASALPYREAVEALVPVPDLSAIEASLRAAPPRTPGRVLRVSRIAAAVAIVFAAGLFAGRYALPPVQPEKTQWARWVDDIAAYQALYTRETLSLGNPDAARRERQMARLSKALGTKIAAPELASLRADFKYARMYAIDGQPLAQIAYLPERGAPFSLCMMKTPMADHPPRFSTARGLNLATWRYHGIAYVLIGAVDRADMDRYIETIRHQQGA